MLGCQAKPMLGAKSCISVLYQVRPLFNWKLGIEPVSVPGLNRLLGPDTPKTPENPFTKENDSLS